MKNAGSHGCRTRRSALRILVCTTRHLTRRRRPQGSTNLPLFQELDRDRLRNQKHTWNRSGHRVKCLIQAMPWRGRTSTIHESRIITILHEIRGRNPITIEINLQIYIDLHRCHRPIGLVKPSLIGFTSLHVFRLSVPSLSEEQRAIRGEPHRSNVRGMPTMPLRFLLFANIRRQGPHIHLPLADASLE